MGRGRGDIWLHSLISQFFITTHMALLYILQINTNYYRTSHWIGPFENNYFTVVHNCLL